MPRQMEFTECSDEPPVGAAILGYSRDDPALRYPEHVWWRESEAIWTCSCGAGGPGTQTNPTTWPPSQRARQHFWDAVLDDVAKQTLRHTLVAFDETWPVT